MTPDHRNLTRSQPAQKEALTSLHKRWYLFAAASLVTIVLTFFSLNRLVGQPAAVRWSITAILAMTAVLGMTWRWLGMNHRPGEDRIMPFLGAGNVVTMARGVLNSLLAGFLLIDQPDGWLGWAPGLLYLVAILGDGLDGALARLTNMPTLLGERMDMEFDSLGMLVGVALCVKYEHTPPWYLLVGLARYLFVIGLWWRERKGLKTYPLTPSTRRRLLAGTQMGLLAILLLPAFKPPGTTWAVAAFGLPLLAGFVWDWFLAIGKIEESDASFQRETLLVRWAGFGVRWMAVGLALFTVLSAGGTLDTNPLMGILLLITAVMIATGILGRVSAFGGLILLGMLQAQGSLDGVQLLLLLSFCGVLMLGCGPFSLLPLEEPLVYGRIGD